MKRRHVLLSVLTVVLTLFAAPTRAETPLHERVLVFIPAYEGSKLYDPDLGNKGEDPACVWGSIDAIRSSKLYLAMRNPNPLLAGPMSSAGPIDVYGRLYEGVTEEQDSSGFHAYTRDADFFVFSYDWRQEIATVTAPFLKDELNRFAKIHEQKTGIPAGDTRFIIVAHSMGGLVARTFLSENPEWANRIAGMYLVGTPNLGSVKSVQTLVVGPGGLKENAVNFPASLLNILPNSVDANLTKLVAISRPSVYELLPFEDPHWECVESNGSRHRVSAQEVLTIDPWQNYWPSAEIEKKLYLNDWLKKRIAEGRKKINVSDWQYCQDPDLRPLQRILSQVRDWRLRMGSLSYTSTLLTRPNEASRLKVVVGTGLKTPTGIITEGSHDECSSRYTYEPDFDGDETVLTSSVMDDLHPAPKNLKVLTGVSHGKLTTDSTFLDYLYSELSSEPTVPASRTAVGQTL